MDAQVKGIADEICKKAEMLAFETFKNMPTHIGGKVYKLVGTYVYTDSDLGYGGDPICFVTLSYIAVSPLDKAEKKEAVELMEFFKANKTFPTEDFSPDGWEKTTLCGERYFTEKVKNVLNGKMTLPKYKQPEEHFYKQSVKPIHALA